MLDQVKQNIKFVTCVAAAVIGWGTYTLKPSSTSPAPVSGSESSPAAKSFEAPRTETVSFQVLSVGGNGTSRYLNSRQNYKDPTNQSVTLRGAAAGIDPSSIIGKHISATGEMRTSKAGVKYLTVTDPSKLVVR